MRRPRIFITVLMWIPAGMVSAQNKLKNFTKAVLVSGGIFTRDGVRVPVFGAALVVDGVNVSPSLSISLARLHPRFWARILLFIGPVSNSRLMTFSSNFQVDMMKRSTKPKLVPFATIRLGQVTSKFTAIPECFCFV